MMPMEQIQSTDMYQINGDVDHGFERTGIMSPDMRWCNSHFFCTQRTQRLAKSQTNIDGETTKGIVIFDIDVPIERFRIRSFSPPTVSLFMNENDGNNSSTKVEGIPNNNLSQQKPCLSTTHFGYQRTKTQSVKLIRLDGNNSSTKVEPIPNNNLSQQKPCLSTTYSGYQRTKTQSVKLTRLDGNNSYPKKFVHFADDFGLELSQIKLINTDELPQVPSEAFKDLQINNDLNSSNPERVKIITYMEPQFQNAIHMQGFNDLVSRNKVLLEQANAIDNRIYGTVRLISLGLQKRVQIRATANNWMSFEDHDAIYIDNSYDGICDRFSFTLEIDRDRICIGNIIQFCICYKLLGGPEYWDSNNQQDYRFNCFSRRIADSSI